MDTKHQPLTMKEMPASEQPYALMERLGARSLTDAQLLALVLQKGTAGESAISLASRLLAKAGEEGREPLGSLFRFTEKEFRAFRGIGSVKAMQLRAIAELALRLSSRQNGTRFKADNPAAVFAYYSGEMSGLQQEIVKAVYLNTKNDLLFDKTVSVGCIDRSVVSPREVFSPALEKGSVKIILLHNHPSGDPSPSDSDILLTKRLSACGSLLEIQLADHIIVGENRFYSMHEKGLL